MVNIWPSALRFREKKEMSKITGITDQARPWIGDAASTNDLVMRT